MVRKKDGSWRPCGDYRHLNLATTHDHYPLPSILNLSNKLHGFKFFFCIDLVKGYHQIPMTAQDIAKTAIITPFSLFEYLFMPFGLRNAAQTFQRFMDRLFKHLRFMFCYLDDLIIATNINNHVSVWPPASQRPANQPTQPQSLPPQSLGGTCGGVLSVPAVFPTLTVT
jgi:hypothetical protein